MLLIWGDLWLAPRGVRSGSGSSPLHRCVCVLLQCFASHVAVARVSLTFFFYKARSSTCAGECFKCFVLQLMVTWGLLSPRRGRQRGGKHLYGWGRSFRDFYSGWAVTYKRIAGNFWWWAWLFLERSPWASGQLIWRRTWRSSGWKVRNSHFVFDVSVLSSQCLNATQGPLDLTMIFGQGSIWPNWNKQIV